MTSTAADAKQGEEEIPSLASEHPRRVKRNPDGSPVRNRISGGVSHPGFVNVERMNKWTYGVRLSPAKLKVFEEAFDLPSEFVKLIAFVDGAKPVNNKFKVGDSPDADEMVFASLLSMTRGSMASAQEEIKDAFEGYFAFGDVELEGEADGRAYLAFDRERQVFLIDLESEEATFVADDFVAFCEGLQGVYHGSVYENS